LLKQKFTDYLLHKYPDLKAEAMPFSDLISENLLSEYRIQIPKKNLLEIQKFIQVIFQIRQSTEYQELAKSKNIFDPKNKAIVMSYDFHYSPENGLKLIEINTNASFLALGCEFYKMQQLPMPVEDFDSAALKVDIQQEWQLNQQVPFPKDFRIWIMDENPSEQRLYAEFLVYKNLFQSWGWTCEIKNSKDLAAMPADGEVLWPHFIYNRDTDFYLQGEHLQNLKTAWKAKAFCLSPQPLEYDVLANKNRLHLLTDANLLAALNLPVNDIALIKKIIPFSQLIHSDNKSVIWEKRKKFFFKPAQSFGSKQAYRGSSISRNIFESFAENEMLAQEFIPAGEVSFASKATEPEKFKFDLRCYAYQDRLEMVIARLYQGQVTNLRTPGGGFALVQVV
jgi:hypothetical protein